VIKRAHGITVTRRETPGKNHLEFRGRGVINAPIVNIMSAIADPVSRKEWIEGCLEVKVLKQINDKEAIFYYAQAAPWPLKDRDYIARSKFIVDEKRKWVHIKVRSIKFKGGPKRNRQRMPFLFAKWSLKPIKKGKASWVEFWVQADPGGIIPTWIANIVTKKVPYKTMMKLRKYLRSGKVDKKFIEKYSQYKDWY